MIEHNHLLLRLECNKVTKPNELDKLNKIMDSLIDSINMKVAMPCRSIFITDEGNEGATYQAGLMTSHLAGHEWVFPDRSLIISNARHLVQFDLYTCGCLNDIQVNIIKEILHFHYDVEFSQTMIMTRGRIFEVKHSYLD